MLGERGAKCTQLLVACLGWMCMAQGVSVGDLYNFLGKLLYSFSSREGWIPYYMVTLGQDGMESGARSDGNMGAGETIMYRR